MKYFYLSSFTCSGYFFFNSRYMRFVISQFYLLLVFLPSVSMSVLWHKSTKGSTFSFMKEMVVTFQGRCVQTLREDFTCNFRKYKNRTYGMECLTSRWLYCRWWMTILSRGSNALIKPYASIVKLENRASRHCETRHCMVAPAPGLHTEIRHLW